jgi:phenylacetate-CoA ligase
MADRGGPGVLRRAGVRLMERVRRTDGLSLLPDLERSQWRAPDEIRATQRAALRDHLRHCRDHVPHYGRLFAERGFDPDAVTSVADLAALPLLDKPAIIAAGADLHADVLPALQPRPKSTSGSTGRPLNYFLDRCSHSYLWAQIWRAWGQTGYRPGDLYATLSGGALLPRQVDLKQRVYLWLSGCVHLPSYHLTEREMDEYAAVLRRRRVRYLYGYPSSLELFAGHLLATGVLPPAMDAVFTTSEMLLPSARATISRAFSAPVFDTYGCNDGGVYAFECEQHDGYHVGDESCVVEVVDEEGRPAPDGRPGLIVTTHLTNRAHPFLRYVTGDVGAIDRRPCACGRGLTRLVSLQGRERDFVVTPDGRRVHGAFFNHFEPFYTSPWLSRFQIHQSSEGSLTVRMEVSREPSAAEREALLGELRRGLGDMEIALEVVDQVELTANGKFRVVICDLPGRTDGGA